MCITITWVAGSLLSSQTFIDVSSLVWWVLMLWSHDLIYNSRQSHLINLLLSEVDNHTVLLLVIRQ